MENYEEDHERSSGDNDETVENDPNEKVVDIASIKQEIKEELKNEILNTPRPDSLLTKIWKLSPWATLIFLIISYIYSVKPVFDKYTELEEKERKINSLQEQIDLKKTDLESYTQKTDSLERANKVQQDELNKTKELTELYRVEVGKIKTEIDAEKQKRQIAEKSATIAHLDKFAKSISAEKFRFDITLKEFDTRKYCKEFIEKETELNKEDSYHRDAIIALESYVDYKGKYDIDNSILYLSYYYEYIYDKEKKD